MIGSHIADQLVAEGIEEIVVLDNWTRGRRQNLEAAIASGKVTVVDGDIRELNPLVIIQDIERYGGKVLSCGTNHSRRRVDTNEVCVSIGMKKSESTAITAPVIEDPVCR